MFEQLLSLITRAVVALEKIAGATPSSAVNAPDAAPEAPAKDTRTRKANAEQPQTPPADDDFLGGDAEPEKEPVYERADVKAALQEYGAKHGMPKAQELFKSASGVSSLSDLPIEKFAAVIKATGIKIKK